MTKTTPLNINIKKDQYSDSASAISSSEPVHTTNAPCASDPVEIDIATLSTKDLQSLRNETTRSFTILSLLSEGRCSVLRSPI